MILTSLLFAGCGKTSSLQEQMGDNNAWKNIKSDCMMWCQIMRKSNESNKTRTVADMDKDCNSLCDASQWMENNDLSSCEKSEWVLKDTCFSEIAQEKKDSTICKKITDKTLLYACYTAIAEDNQDASLCENIDEKMRKWICVDSAKGE